MEASASFPGGTSQQDVSSTHRPVSPRPTGIGARSSRVEISVSCRGLPRSGTLTKRNVMAVLFVPVGGHSHQYVELGRSEIVKNTLAPSFLEEFFVNYYFGEVQPLKISIYDVVNLEHHMSLDAQTLLGEVHLTLGELLSSRQPQVAKDIISIASSGPVGTIFLHAEEVHSMSEYMLAQFVGRDLERKDFFGSSDPFLVISRTNEDGTYFPVAKTETIMNTLNPEWQPFSVSLQKLCNGQYDRPLLFEVFDWNSSGNHELIGRFKTNVSTLQREDAVEFKLWNPKKRAKRGEYQPSGRLDVVDIRIFRNYTFLDYVMGGCEISLIVAIDFTTSNGDPSDPASLHFRRSREGNKYEEAIRTVCSILEHYDSDKTYPVFGFGALVPPHGILSHCFALNGDSQHPEVGGVDGIVDAYYSALDRVSFLGPTMFSHVIRMASTIAARRATQENQHYNVLLILSDGNVSDLENTIEAIIRASVFPLSIVIVGVGDGDFASMEVLDSDHELLKTADGKQAERDIVQFVPLSKYGPENRGRLFRDVLEEIPRQLLSYMNARGIIPNEARIPPPPPPLVP